MITSCYRPADGILRFDLERDGIAAALAEPDGLLWVDIDADGRDEIEPLLRDVFKFHHLTIDDCFNTLIDPPKIDDYGSYLFIIVHDVTYDAAEHDLTTVELDMYVGTNYVVTVHRFPVDAVNVVRKRAEGRGLLINHGADFLAHALFDVVVDQFHPVVEQIDDQVSELQEHVIDRPERGTLQDVLRLKRVVQRLKRSILPQRDVANRLSRGEYDRLIKRESLMYYRDIYDHTVRVEDMVDSLRDLADSSMNTYLSSVNNRTNEVMKTLAIVTVVLLPLTVITGVYGTNFDYLPEITWRYGYFGMLAVMLAVAVALVAWFRWRRWI